MLGSSLLILLIETGEVSSLRRELLGGGGVFLALCTALPQLTAVPNPEAAYFNNKQKKLQLFFWVNL